MSKIIRKSDNLPSLQKSIVLYLAETEPQTINQTAKAISKGYRPTWTAFNSLENKKIIIKTGNKNYRNQDFPCYWLTDEGMIMSLMEGSDANKLLERTKILYPNADAAHIFLEVIPMFDPQILKLSYNYAKAKGKLEFVEVAQVILSGAAAGLEIETGKKVADALKKHPKHYEALKTVVQEMIKTLNYLIED
jgi:predicted transcriptional regulator